MPGLVWRWPRRKRAALYTVVLFGVVGSGVGAYAISVGGRAADAPPVGGSELGDLVANVDGARLYAARDNEVGPNGETDRICYSVVAPGQAIMGGCGSQETLDRSGTFFAAPPVAGRRHVWVVLPVGATALRQAANTKAVSGKLATLQVDAGKASLAVETTTSTVTIDVP